jgi:hypothetical protein
MMKPRSRCLIAVLRVVAVNGAGVELCKREPPRVWRWLRASHTRPSRCAEGSVIVLVVSAKAETTAFARFLAEPLECDRRAATSQHNGLAL